MIQIKENNQRLPSIIARMISKKRFLAGTCILLCIYMLLFRQFLDWMLFPAESTTSVTEEEIKQLKSLAADWRSNFFDDSKSDPPPIVKILWIYWEQGMDHLESLGGSKSYYSSSYQCVKAWQKLHEGSDWDVRVISKGQAMELAPTYKRIVNDPTDTFNSIHLSNLLRLELLTLYGGVWADTSICPFRHLDDFIPQLLEPWGFFAPFWGGRYLAGDRKGKELDYYHNCHEWNDGTNKRGNFITNKIRFLVRLYTWTSAKTRSIDNWFLAAAKPQHIIMKYWLEVLTDRIDKIITRKSSILFPYFLTQCTFTQLRRKNATVEAVFTGFREAGAEQGQHYWSVDGSDGICTGSKESGSWQVRRNGEYAKKHCFFVKKQTEGLLRYVLSPQYLEYIEHIKNGRAADLKLNR